MAKRNRNRLKKRRKRQLEKRISLTTKAVPAVAVKEVPPVNLYLGKYSQANEQYQKALDSIHGEGTVTPIERYINPRTSILHHCSECDREFYNAPQFLLKTDKHDCNAPKEWVARSGSFNSSKGKAVTWDDFYDMVWKDFTYQQIAQKLQINPKIVKDYFLRVGLIEK